MPLFATLPVPVFSSLCNLAFALRRAVFVGEQGVAPQEEFDAHDLEARHFVAVGEGEVCGTLRVIETLDHHRLGRIAVLPRWRGQGVARAMIEAALAERRAAGVERFHLSAQADKVALYERFGFRPYGEVFQDGGMPHRAMKTY